MLAILVWNADIENENNKQLQQSEMKQKADITEENVINIEWFFEIAMVVKVTEITYKPTFIASW